MTTNRLKVVIKLGYNVLNPGADFIFNVHAAVTAYQKVEKESFLLNQPVKADCFTCQNTGNRFIRLKANPGILTLSYEATVAVSHYECSPDSVQEISICDLPTSVLSYIYPSRYCQSDRLTRFAIRTFGKLPRGYSRVIAIQTWVRDHIAFVSNTTNSSTSAIDSIVEGVGVCRDFAHLMIAMCRALSIPARIVTGTDFGANPSLGPPDLHAYVEVYLGGRWFLFDPSGTTIPAGLIRIGTGRDAADVSYATIFGTVKDNSLMVSTKAVDDNCSAAPLLTAMALSTSEV